MKRLVKKTIRSIVRLIFTGIVVLTPFVLCGLLEQIILQEEIKMTIKFLFKGKLKDLNKAIQKALEEERKNK